MSVKGIFEPQSVLFKILLLIFCIAFLGSMATLTIAGIASLALDTELTELTNPLNYSDSNYMFWIKTVQTISSVFTFLLPALLTAYLISKRPSSYLLLSNQTKIKQVILATILLIAAVPLVNLLIELNSYLVLPESFYPIEQWILEKEEAAKSLTEALLMMDSIGDLLFNLLMIGVVAALGEEILFRGLIQTMLTKWIKNYHAGIWIAAIIFSAIHMQFYGFVPRMLLGVMFGYLLVWTGSLWVPILAHFIHNSFVVITAYIVQAKELNLDYEKLGTEAGDLIYLIPAFIFTAYILFTFYTSRYSDDLYAINKNGSTHADPFNIN